MKKMWKYSLALLMLTGLFAGYAMGADLVAAGATVQADLGAALPLLDQLTHLPLNTLGLLMAVSLIGGFIMEHGLEHFAMDHVPDKIAAWFKPLLPYLVGLLPAVITEMQGGKSLGVALLGGLAAAVTATAKHDVAPAVSAAAALDATKGQG